MSKPFFILFIISLSLSLVAQDLETSYKNIKFRKYTTKDGLSQRSVISIFQDKNGFLWFGTRYGLNRFDGNVFKTYIYNLEDENTLGHNWITKVLNDSLGNIWVATKKGLNKYIPKTDSFNRVKHSNSFNFFYDKEIWDLISQDSTFLWLATNRGLDRYNIRTGKFLSFNHNVNNFRSISSDKTRALVLDNKKRIWVATTEAVDLYNPNLNTFTHYSYPNKLNPSLTKNNNVVLFQDTKNRIWLGHNNGLSYFNEDTKSFVDFKIDKKKVISSSVRALYEDTEGNLWIGTYKGLYVLESENVLYKYEHDITNDNSLSQNSVYSIFEDNRGDLWVGTWAGGINYFDKSSSNFTTFSAGFTKKNLNYGVVSSFEEDFKGNFWITTEGGGLNYYNSKTGNFKYYNTNYPLFRNLRTNNIKVVLKDYTNNFWVGTHRGGLGYLNLKKGIKYQTFDNNTSYKGLSDSNITALEEDEYHNIWIGTNEEGLYVYNEKEKEFSHVTDTFNSIGNFIYTIEKSKSDKTIFIGSENGLSRVNLVSKQIETIKFREQSNKGKFNLNSVISIYQGDNENLWIGTEGDGLYCYNFKTNQSNRYGLKQGLPNEVIYGILNSGNTIWLSTNSGLCEFNLETKLVNNYYESDGIQANEFNYGAHYKSSKGELLFGGINGFTIFDPENIKKNSFVPPVAITSFSVRNKNHTIITDSTKLIKLKHNQNDFSFEFVALDYSHPDKNQYAYILEGFDNDWNFIKNNKTAVYTNISPGDYEFKVKASNSDGIWNETGATIKLNITPPMWKTWWAYLLYVIVSAIIFLVLRKHELSRIRSKNELKQERLDKEQMEEVNRLKLQLFTNISHDFRTPLTLIAGPLKKILDQKMGSSVIQDQLKGVYRNVTILLQLINQLLDFRKSEAGKLNLQPSKQNIIMFLQDTMLLFDALAVEENIKLLFETSETNIDVWFDRIEMKKVILNILSNAFKFTPRGGEIRIKVSKFNNSKKVQLVMIEISDTGKGIREGDLTYVFDRFFQLGQQNELRSGTGVGLALAKDIIDLHNGSISVKSELGRGSIFTILLPLGNAHFNPETIIEDVNYEDSHDYFSALNIKTSWIRDNLDKNEHPYNKDLETILLVEDNFEVRQFIKEIFIGDFNILEATNGQEGIHQAKLNQVNVIISDVMMPEMDGMQMCDLLKSDIVTSHIPVILLTARTSSKMQKRGYEKGADVYLTKPFEGAILKQQVFNIIRSRQSLIEKFRKDVLLEPKEITVVSTDEAFLKKAMAIIEDNLSTTDFNVNSFIEKMYMSQSVLYRKIKALTGQSISEFIRSIRLKKASHLILESNMTISEIAYEVGFNDLKYFRKCFKETFKVTPSQYRKK